VDGLAAAVPRAEARVLRKLFALALVALAAGVAGGWVLFEREDEDDRAARGWSTCTNPVEGFSVDYPAGWYTDHPEPRYACTYFDPRPFELEPAADWGPKALQVTVAPEDTELGGVDSRTEVEIGGRDAIRYQSSSGDGFVAYGYRVDEGGRAFSIFTTSNPGVGYSALKRVVEHAAGSLVVSETRDATTEEIDVPPPLERLPEPVARKRAQIWTAARRKDYDGLARLVDPAGFEYTFGGPVPGGPAAYWRRLEQSERPLDTLAAILELPYTYQPESKLYVWPYAFTRKASTLSISEKKELADAIGEEGLRFYEQSDTYLGYRAGIDVGGDWVFYVAGD
jgi:hypothetical protein